MAEEVTIVIDSQQKVDALRSLALGEEVDLVLDAWEVANEKAELQERVVAVDARLAEIETRRGQVGGGEGGGRP